MIRTMRSSAKWIMGVLVVAFVGWMVFDVGMGITGGSSYRPGDAIAKVNGTRIDLQTYNDALRNTQERQRLQTGSAPLTREGQQALDYRMVITHEGKHTTSDVFLKGAVEDDAQSVFSGLLRIEKDAKGTSTFETNRNLVLSENAKAQSVPNLEILCDDVVCGHGSSVGPLEQEHLYYLQSRGLTRVRAERLLIRGFFQEVIDRLPIEAVGGPVSEEVFRRFVSAQEEGRVA